MVDERYEKYTARLSGGTTALHSSWHSRKEGAAKAVAEVSQLDDGLSIRVMQTRRYGSRYLCGYTRYCEGLFEVTSTSTLRRVRNMAQCALWSRSRLLWKSVLGRF